METFSNQLSTWGNLQLVTSRRCIKENMKDEETGAGDSVVAAGNRKIEKESPKAICVNSHTVQVPTSSATMLAEGVRENPFHKLNKLDISEVDVAAITLTDDNDDAFLPNNFPERGLEIVAGDDNDDAEEVSQSWTMKNNRKTNQLTLDYKNIRKSRKRKGKNVECDIDTICKGDFAEQNILLSSDGDIPCDNRQKIIIGDALLSQEKDFSNDDGRISFYSIFTSKSRFSLLDVQEVELDDETLKSISESCPSVEDESFALDPSEEDKEMSSKKDTNVCGTKNTSKGEKKSKKKERKKTQVDEDVAKILEQLTLKVDVKRPGSKTKKFVGGTSTNEGSAIMSSVARKQLKKKRKKIDSESSVEHAEKDPGAELLLEDRAVKTAVRKKKNKKRARQNSIRISSEEVSDFKVNETQLEKSVEQDAETSALCSVLSNVSDPPAIDEKKNTLGKVCLEEKKDKKGPGKKQIAAMVEAIKKFEVEEKRVKLEEEAKLRKDEEEERLRNEKFILEQEKRDKKKQKEKEKRERLKAEGKLLSKSQKQSRARMEASLAALRQQGIDVPQIGEKRVCTTRQADFKKTSKKNSWPKSNSNINSAEIKLMTVDSIGNDASPIVDVPISETCDIKNKSEISSDEQTLESQGRHFLTSVINCNGETNINKNIGEISSRHVSYEEGSPSEMLRQSSSESESGDKKNITKRKVTAVERIKKLSEESEKNRSTSKLRSPVVCVLGHVDTGKTKLLDKIRKSHVQDGEAGGITQQIGATMIPQEALQEKCKMAKSISEIVIKIPGLLIIDTPGHESFSNLRSRGSSLCDIAILVVDIMHGLEPQTVESINLLKQKKTPFIVALNKIDRLYGWKPGNEDVENIIKSQGTNTKLEFDDRCKEVILQFAHQGLNATLFYENSDPRSYISIVPTSALTGEGMGNLLALVIQLTQSMMAKRLAYSEELLATVLEVKAISGLGTTIDVILVNGRLREADTIILAGQDGPVVTQIRSLLMPQPLKELRVKNPYQEHREVVGAQGVKICGKDLEKAIAGLPLFVAHHKDEVKILREKIISSFQNVMNSIRLAERGVYVQSSTLGSLEVLLKLLKASNIPYAGIKIGPVVKKDVMKASVMLEHEILYAVILAFDVKIERDAQELADNLGVIIFHADIIYHLLDTFTAFKESKEKEKEEIKKLAVFPCKLRIVSENVMNTRKHIRIYVIVEAGVLKIGTPLCVPSKHLDIGTVTSIEINKKHLESAKKGDEVLVKIKNYVEDAPKIYGEHFNHDDPLISKITRQTIDICKEYYRDDLSRSDWQLMGELKKVFLIT